MVKCSKGHEVSDSANFCGACGEEMPRVVQSRPGLGRILVEGAVIGVGLGVGSEIGRAAASAALGKGGEQAGNIPVEGDGLVDGLGDFLG
jgi:hypothetical protein